MKISELFYSIQGEGKRAGRPSFFIRTNHCNLRCSFPGGNLCDTYYTSWDPDDKRNLGEMKIDEIAAGYEDIKCGDIVITGGEPAMYSEDLTKLCIKLKQINPESFITIETNGTYFGDFVKFTELMSISPKLRSSVPFMTEFEKMHDKNRINLETFKKFCILKENYLIDIQWKFVFTSEKDIDEIRELQSAVGFDDSDIYLMPEGITAEDLAEKRTETIEICKKNNFNYTDRLHIIAWGNKRGV